eukprot:CAMPEP_0197669170 /NCGR_PEP_ID=MMETSP1338-20131121/71304_1 /TAXON_ID=43686 ORGANISM="Pelagodinium beii, Strain RCC1491" /NCGR_SAMPLE_ID=MMETSP1338 /ASSEMBLY_ACC=CAM_ASM_000754 /LENGTH=72 /DNA_ID=CAMNT_0043248675 /DNA_START=23 /DNA_END=238 /DNA_ORIENTATION=-
MSQLVQVTNFISDHPSLILARHLAELQSHRLSAEACPPNSTETSLSKLALSSEFFSTNLRARVQIFSGSRTR